MADSTVRQRKQQTKISSAAAVANTPNANRGAEQRRRSPLVTFVLLSVASVGALVFFAPAVFDSIGLGSFTYGLSKVDQLVARNVRAPVPGKNRKSAKQVLPGFRPTPYKGLKAATPSEDDLYPISVCPVPALSTSDRIDCGDENMTRDGCIAARCCWSTQGRKKGPSCYLPPKNKEPSKHLHTIPRPDLEDLTALNPLTDNQISSLQAVVSGDVTTLSRRAAPAAASCVIDIARRVDCGFTNVTACNAANCCWSPAAGGPSCFSTVPLPILACKTLANTKRVDCGNKNTTATSCVASGCCWSPLPAGTAGPYCFSPGSCTVAAADRIDAGNANTTAASCAASGACWSPLPAGTKGPYCFYPGFGTTAVSLSNPATCPATALDPTLRTDCTFTSQANCVGGGCCWGGTPGPYCYTPGSPQPGSDVGVTLNATTPNPGCFTVLATAPVASWATALMPNTGKILAIERFSGGKVGTTHVYEFDYTTLTFRPLHVLTDIFCSGAFQIADGRVVSFGGYTNDNLGQALTGVRIYTPSGSPGIDGTTDWFEDPTKSILQVTRWYPGSHALPDGRIVAIGGTTDVAPPGVLQPTIEFLNTPNTPPQFLQYLVDTNGANLYPFAWNIPAGGQIPEPGVMAIFARNILGYFDVTTQPGVVTELFRAPNAPVAKPAKAGQRVYPLAGGAFMLPAVPDANNNPLPLELLICGGSTGSNINATAIDNCVRGFPQQGTKMTWTIEPMPTPRLFPDLVALPDGTVLIINGATKGWSGFAAAQNPIMTALIYNSTAPFGSRYTTVATSTIARLYHSLAILGPDGRVFVLGSTPNANSNINDFGPVWPDEYRIEAYVPAYVSYSGPKPSISAVTYDPDTFSWSYDQSYTITAVVPSGDPANIKFNLLTGKFINTALQRTHGHLIKSFALLLIISTGGFVTHANHFGQRQAYLLITDAAASTDATAPANTFVFTVRAPKSAWVALQGYYMLWIVENNIPAAQANWVQLGGIPPLQADWHPELP
ncbi:hypothetical protein HDU88_008320 [Geranomyces variabilis]|nr:hypothetical protein HDU88_008320 [Geranomyces variabilis]